MQQDGTFSCGTKAILGKVGGPLATRSLPMAGSLGSGSTGGGSEGLDSDATKCRRRLIFVVICDRRRADEGNIDTEHLQSLDLSGNRSKPGRPSQMEE